MCYMPLSRFTGSVECCITIILLSSISKKIRFPENFSGKYDLAEWILVDDDDDDDDDLLYRSNATVRK